MLSKEERNETRALSESASPEPWRYEYSDYSDEHSYRIGNAEYVLGRGIQKNDAEFIVNARQAVPKLLNALEDAEADRDRWKARAEALELDIDLTANIATTIDVETCEVGNRGCPRGHRGLLGTSGDSGEWGVSTAKLSMIRTVLHDLGKHISFLSTRAKALERAIKTRLTACSTCAKKPSEGYCDELYDCINENFSYSCWVFDEARFAGRELLKGDGDE